MKIKSIKCNSSKAGKMRLSTYNFRKVDLKEYQLSMLRNEPKVYSKRDLKRKELKNMKTGTQLQSLKSLEQEWRQWLKLWVPIFIFFYLFCLQNSLWINFRFVSKSFLLSRLQHRIELLNPKNILTERMRICAVWVSR